VAKNDKQMAKRGILLKIEDWISKDGMGGL
jgi:hypothetical protein